MARSSERNFTGKKPFYLRPFWAQHGALSVSPPCPLQALLPQLLQKTQALPTEGAQRGDPSAEVKSRARRLEELLGAQDSLTVHHTPPTAKGSRGSQRTLNLPAAITLGLWGSGSIPWFTPHPSQPWLPDRPLPA